MAKHQKNLKSIASNEFQSHLKDRLEHEQEPLSPGINYRLRKARQKAVEASSKSKLPYWKPMLSAASFAVVVLAIGFFVMPGNQLNTDAITSNDSEILLEDNDFEFYEDLEFYAWLADNNF
ncbi:hypothetical protein NBRC116493_34870 [Aurantivibrio infirmus]